MARLPKINSKYKNNKLNGNVPPKHRVMVDTLAANLQPVRGGKVNGLRKVVTLVKSSVVRARECYHKLPGLLIRPTQQSQL